MSELREAEQLVRRLLDFVDRGVMSVDEAIAKIHEGAMGVAPYLGHPDCARRFNDRVVALTEICDQAIGVSTSASLVSGEMSAYRTRWNNWYGRWTGRRSVLRYFDEWGDPAMATETVTRLCDEAISDNDDRFIEAAARDAAEHDSIAAVAAIVPLDYPDRYRLGANHGSVTAIRMLRSLADQGSSEAQEHLRRLAAVAEWTARPLDS